MYLTSSTIYDFSLASPALFEEKFMFVTDSYFFDGTKKFRLTLKPSSVIRSLDVVTRDLKKFSN